MAPQKSETSFRFPQARPQGSFRRIASLLRSPKPRHEDARPHPGQVADPGALEQTSGPSRAQGGLSIAHRAHDQSVRLHRR